MEELRDMLTRIGRFAVEARLAQRRHATYMRKKTFLALQLFNGAISMKEAQDELDQFCKNEPELTEAQVYAEAMKMLGGR